MYRDTFLKLVLVRLTKYQNLLYKNLNCHEFWTQIQTERQVKQNQAFILADSKSTLERINKIQSETYQEG